MGYKDPAKQAESARRWALKHPDRAKTAQLKCRHGLQIFDWLAETWSTQDGKCYLCGDQIPSIEKAVIEHDHRCCPKFRSCGNCRRGLACQLCNCVVGYGLDDPERLRRIADNLEIVLEKLPDFTEAQPLWEE